MVLELHVDQPLIDIRVLAERPVLLTNVTALISGFAMFGSFVLVPRFVETPGNLPAGIAAQVDYGFGASATTTGLYLLPGSLLMLFAGPAAGLLGRRVGSKWPLAIGMSLIAISAATLAVLHDEPWQVVVAMAGLSVGVGFAFAAMAALITEAVEPTETGIATGINTVMRTVGAVVGAQVGAAILTAQTLGETGVPTEGAYVSAFVLAAAAAAVATAIAVFVTPTAKTQAGGDRRGGRVSRTSEAKQVAAAIEGLLAALLRQRRSGGDPEPGSLSTFQWLTLARLVDQGPVRLGSLADALGTTDATASRTVDVLEASGLAERRDDPGDARGVIVAATTDGTAEVRRRRRTARQPRRASARRPGPGGGEEGHRRADRAPGPARPR